MLIGRGVRIICSRNALLTLGDKVVIDDYVHLYVGDGGQIVIPDNFQLGKRTFLSVTTEWKIGEGSRVGGDCEILSREAVKPEGRLVLGNRSQIAGGALIDLTDNVIIHDDVSLGPNVTIYTHNHQYLKGITSTWKTPVEKGEVEIGAGSWIGTSVIILPGVKIGKMVVVAAGSVVTKSIPDNSVYGGVPAKLLKTIITK